MPNVRKTGSRRDAAVPRWERPLWVCPPHYHLVSFDIREPSDIDAGFKQLLREAYHQSGCQEFLKSRVKS